VTRIGLYGGSFDPIHWGHVRPVLSAVEQLRLDRVVYLPTAQPPHKPGAEFAPALRRFVMVELAVRGDDRLRVSDFELSARPSYTIDTIEHFAGREPECELHLLIGSDSLAQIDSWRRWRDILGAVRLGVLARPGWNRDEVLASVSPDARRFVGAETVVWVDSPALEIASTEVRRRLCAGEPVPRDWVPEAVVQYAKKYCLYS